MNSDDLLYNLYVDKYGCLRMVMEVYKGNIVRGMDVSNMTIDGLYVTEDLRIGIYGTGDFDYKRNKVIWD